MPELPEVETVVRDLRPLLVGKRITRVRVGADQLRRPWQSEWKACVVGRRFAGIRRRGKWIIADFERGGHLLVHLGMTGQLTVVQAQAEEADHTHIVFTLTGNRHELRYRDVRRFGSVEYCPRCDLVERMLDEKLGPEPWNIPTDWHATLVKSRRSLKAILLDQRIIAGVGNIYADEALFEARLPPTKLGNATLPAEAKRLSRCVVEVLERAIAARGSTIQDYVGGSGLRGGYQNEFRVYGRTGQACIRCRSKIASIRLAGRSTHFCPRCQRSAARA